MGEKTKTKYVPAWKHTTGNRLIFAAPNHLFDKHADACVFQMSESLAYSRFGLTANGIVKVEIDDNKSTEIPHVIANLGELGPCLVISGPAFDVAIEKSSADVQEKARELNG